MPIDFEFFDDPGHGDGTQNPVLVLRIPAEIHDKDHLLAILAHGLQFPSYFGWNWDALEECLHDLSWIDSRCPIRLQHEALPFPADSDELLVYLSILNGVVSADATDRPHRLVVSFPANAERQLNLRYAMNELLTAAGSSIPVDLYVAEHR